MNVDLRFINKVILFQEPLQHHEAIVHYYNRQTNIVTTSVCVPPFLTWHVTQMIVDVLSPIVTTCVLNQSHEHRLLSVALHSAITMNTKLNLERL
jgi:uncharacterized membrane protein